ncbi:MAG: DUF1501 domain-containing protein, partial [Pirellulaceae bacterium]|nr:DUF1501 domain-containing protein [Pirellulaceae bacterium]
MNHNHLTSACSGGHASRRAVLRGLAGGLGSIALMDLLSRDTQAASAPDPGALARVFAPRAKRVIFLFMHGGPSHIDTFDYKPMLNAHDGKELPFAKPRVQFAKTGNLLRSPWRFRQYGQSGAWVSDLFQQTAAHVDDMTFIKSLHGSNAAHGGALLKVHTGSDTFVRPSMGAWIGYGLGTENQNLPSFITINPTLGHGGVQNFGAGFLPAQHQATRIGSGGGRKGQAGSIANLENSYLTSAEQREQLELTQTFNRHQLDRTAEDSQLSARIQSLELAFRMQTEAPEVLDLANETEATLRLYGMDQEATKGFGRSCLLARRLSEAGVRFVQATHAYWDQHSELREKHSELAGQVDRPIAGLLSDLKARGLLDETLVIWGAEFGRTPTAQGNNGRDHNPHAFTYWMAGGGVKRGFSYGETDDYGFYAAQDKVHVHDFHATLLYLLGIDHERLTFRLGGRDFRLTDIHG